MNLTHDQVARVFSMYLGSKVFLDETNLAEPVDDNVFTLIGVTTESILLQEVGVWYKLFVRFGFHSIVVPNKLLLKPLSAITDEDAIEFCNLFLTDEGSNGGKIETAKNEIRNSFNAGIFMCEWDTYQYLIQQGYAVPIFIAPNHPDNGKTALELGLAIDTTVTKNQSI
jgi:hypothetical protein